MKNWKDHEPYGKVSGGFGGVLKSGCCPTLVAGDSATPQGKRRENPRLVRSKGWFGLKTPSA